MKALKKILAVSYGGEHIKMLTHIIQLLNKKNIDVKFLALTSAGLVPLIKNSLLRIRYYTSQFWFMDGKVKERKQQSILLQMPQVIQQDKYYRRRWFDRLVRCSL